MKNHADQFQHVPATDFALRLLRNCEAEDETARTAALDLVVGVWRRVTALPSTSLQRPRTVSRRVALKVSGMGEQPRPLHPANLKSTGARSSPWHETASELPDRLNLVSRFYPQANPKRERSNAEHKSVLGWTVSLLREEG